MAKWKHVAGGALAIILAVALTPIRPTSASGQLEMLIRIPRAGTPEGMLTRICRPHAGGRTGLVIVNHGSPPISAARAKRAPAPCGEVASIFTKRGLTVAFPLRRGYGETGGAWAEGYGKCHSPDYLGAGAATADDIEAALAHLRTLPFIASSPAIIVGQSAGGWGTLVLASRNPKHAAVFVNFAGGRGAGQQGRGDSAGNCTPEALIAAAAVLGKTTRSETLWIYTENDRLIGKALSRRMHDAYQRAGGRGRFALLAPFGSDGHNLFFARGGSRIWGPIVDDWLDRVLPK